MRSSTGAGCEYCRAGDSEYSGQKAINYRTEPFWTRFVIGPTAADRRPSPPPLFRSTFHATPRASRLNQFMTTTIGDATP